MNFPLKNGRFRAVEIDGIGIRPVVRPLTRWYANKLQYDAAAIVANLLAKADRKFQLSTMYVEFANLADPDTIPTNPAIGYGDGIGYFAGLIDSADRDYMRLPVRFSSVETDDADLYPHGHLVRLLARTSGENGIHGKPFSDINNSAVVGGALVAPFDPDDFTRDLIYCRFYFDEADVQLKLATGQISIEYEVNLAL